MVLTYVYEFEVRLHDLFFSKLKHKIIKIDKKFMSNVDVDVKIYTASGSEARGMLGELSCCKNA